LRAKHHTFYARTENEHNCSLKNRLQKFQILSKNTKKLSPHLCGKKAYLLISYRSPTVGILTSVLAATRETIKKSGCGNAQTDKRRKLFAQNLKLRAVSCAKLTTCDPHRAPQSNERGELLFLVLR
jgi:hypothetical protein